MYICVHLCIINKLIYDKKAKGSNPLAFLSYMGRGYKAKKSSTVIAFFIEFLYSYALY